MGCMLNLKMTGLGGEVDHAITKSVGASAHGHKLFTRKDMQRISFKHHNPVVD